MSRPTGRDADPRRTIPLNSTRWRKLRAAVLAQEPLCRMCSDVASVVDHASGDPSDNRRENLVGLCAPCHNHKTRRQRAGLPAIVGCDVNGWPLDPAHHWNNEKSPEGEAPKTVRPPSLYRYGRG